jgi:aminopeptidase N
MHGSLAFFREALSIQFPLPFCALFVDWKSHGMQNSGMVVSSRTLIMVAPEGHQDSAFEAFGGRTTLLLISLLDPFEIIDN